jgi:hypothetical protein
MKLRRYAVAAFALAALGATGLAQARGNVAWSVGINAVPGISVGVGNYGPVYAAPPVYVAPAPVYYAPAPVYYAPPVTYVRPSVYYAAPVYYGRGRHWHGGYHHHRR